MQIETTRHNFYSYLRQTGEIVPGIVADDDYVWTFEPSKSFMAMPEVEMFILGLTEQCNLRCKYCCYSGDYQRNRTHSNHCMEGDDIEIIYDFIDSMTSIRPLHIAFYGGEPLTQYNLMRYAITKAEERWGEEVVFSVTTNATLLSVERIDWLMAHHVKLEISIDGTAKFHDRYRVDLTGKGSFHRMYRVLSYIVNEHQEYLTNVQLLMTLPSVEDLPAIAEYWNDDDVLRQLSPSHITGLAPNFANGVTKKDYETLKEQYLTLLDIYEQHQDWMVLKTYFDECIAYWIDRPIVDAGRSVPMSTCMPRNTKLYIDANKQIAVCEKISDHYRIGNIQEGIDWNKANTHVREYYHKRVQRCSRCPAIRGCDLCLTAIEFNEAQWDVLCHNERVYAQLYMLLFCEMAEREMLTKPSVPTLQTEHCTLNEIEENDIAALRAIFSDADTQRYLPALCDIARTDDGIKQILKSFRIYLSKNEGVLWGIRNHDTLVGFVATMDLSTNPTILFAMHPKYRNQGYMQESVRLATQYICDTKLTNELHTEVDVNNIASQKVLECCGYKVQKKQDSKYQ